MNCPFCDSPAWKINMNFPEGEKNFDAPPIWFVSCMECNASGPQKKGSWEAAKAWMTIKKAPEIALTISEATA